MLTIDSESTSHMEASMLLKIIAVNEKTPSTSINEWNFELKLQK